MINFNLLNKVNTVKEQIRTLYLDEDKYPWIVGYSGGKDSSLVTQLVFETLIELKKEGFKLDRDIYVVSSDTLVENPIVSSHFRKNLKEIKKYGKELNIFTEMVVPDIQNTFWVNIIGRGYPVPNQTFRWCTDRLKIKPVSDATQRIAKDYGKVIIFLGSRLGESASRDRIINQFDKNELLQKHPTLSYAYQFMPIVNFELQDIWQYLLQTDCPWGGKNNSYNRELFLLYEQSSSIEEECPWALDLEKNARSCGSSRWGCWSCTVVQKDKSLALFANNGYSWLQPLVEFRDKLQEERNNRDNRYMGGIAFRNGKIILKKHTMKLTKNIINGEEYLILKKQLGRDEIKIKIDDLENNRTEYRLITEEEFRQVPILEIFNNDEYRNIIIRYYNDNYRIIGVGPYTLAYRKKLLDKLVELQKILGNKVEVISDEEIDIIHALWEKTENKLRGRE